jgi:hypothetical protein
MLSESILPLQQNQGLADHQTGGEKCGIQKKDFSSSLKTFGRDREAEANGKSQGFTASFRSLIDFHGNEVSFYFNPGRFFEDPAASGIQRE